MEFLELLELSLMPVEDLLSTLLSAIAVVAVYYLTKFLKKNFDDKEQEVIREIARDGVLFAQEVFEHLDGPKRYEKAMEHVSRRLKDLGIKIDAKDLEDIIHSVLKEVKSEFGALWSKEDEALLLEEIKDKEQD